ncbi:Metallo-peptidase family M12B Reprolysin-like-domain-containing protein [Endogone sp. FLAS-F59071]|nr:Metallo-peptidase family M12B Reprolysin-like-domain-containing protein [Endogone sp. FLAS-F59071]|eukprot:RUS13245.1 Metallo-peptidase family M12B Reprolysin-like-domain-containing protein [Endogone sp. FLAS-F59071]
MLCQTSATVQQASDGTSEYVSGTGVSSITRDEWKVVAHEIGHGFGAIHDCTAQLCPCIGDCGCCPLSAQQCDAGGTYIMNPTSNVSTNDFSPCSITDICHAFPTSGFCLQAPGTLQVETLAMCGNGIVEAGEECDPGGTDDACCYAKTCLFKPGAQCDDYNDECCQSCTIRPAMAICRPAQSSCDIAEYCNVDTALAWLDQNKAIAIPTGVIFGLIICSFICLCLLRCRRRRMINKFKHSRPPSASTPPRSHNSNSYPLSGYPSIASRGSTSWVDFSPYNGSALVPPQPAHSPPRHDHGSDASTITPRSSGFPADSWNTIGRNSDGSYLLAGSSPSTRGTSSPSRTIHVGAIPSSKTTPARRNNTTVYGGSDNSDQWLSATYESSLPTTSLPPT